jgi:hypothetical protein
MQTETRTGGNAGRGIDAARGGCLYLCYHHVAIKGASAVGASGTVDVRADLGDDWGSKGHVGDEVAIHDVYLGRVSRLLRLVGLTRQAESYVKPVSTLADGIRACSSQLCEVGRQD